MRILMAQKFHFYRGGDSTYMFNLTKLHRDRGHKVAHFSMSHPENIESEYSGYFASEIDFPQLLEDFSPRSAAKVITKSIYNREAARNITELIESFKPDIAHFHNIHDHLSTSIVKPFYSRGIPIVWTLHDYRLICPNSTFLSKGEICERCLPGRFYNVLLRRCKKGSLPASLVAMLSAYFGRLTRVKNRVSHFITPSLFLKGKLVSAGFDEGRITAVPNFVDLSSFASDPEEEDYFIYSGRLSFEKGIDILIEAAAKLQSGRLLIVGGGPEEERLKGLAARLGADNVEFTGHKSKDELRHILSRAQFAVLPSRWYENLPFSIIEAFAVGKAVVASDIGGIPEMVKDGVNGYLFPPGDSGILAARLEKLISSPALRRELGQRGREKAEKVYNSKSHYEKITEIYNKVLKDKGIDI
ncbi:MAG: glycosyltransferase family 4 protein [Candidatus Krumholzibacteriota bacterium]|nr:glycosyltransferase family 4 protein [Candidatus Krumholzibacteriota bacterium]